MPGKRTIAAHVVIAAVAHRRGITLDGKPAEVRGQQSDEAIIIDKDNPDHRIRVPWATVARVAERDGVFKS